VAALLAAGRAATPPRPRTTIVVSDLHLGIGRDASGGWHPFEDLRWADEFEGFLKAVDRAGAGEVDLVLNGDAIDFPQAAEAGCEAGPGCSDADLLARLDRVLGAHRAEVGALGAFARSGTNRVTFVPGDADAALLLPAVGRRLIGAIGAPPDRVTMAADGYWLSSDGRVHAEHGQHLVSSGQRPEGWPAPVVRHDGRDHLALPAGERMTAELYRRLERTYPVVDNVAVLGAGLKLALGAEAAAGAAGAAQLTPDLLRFLLLSTISWQQFRMELDDGDVEPPEWDLPRVRAQGGEFLLATLPHDDPIRAAVARTLPASALEPAAAALTDEEITTICDYRAAVRRSRRRFEPFVSQFAPRGPAVAECPRTAETRGGLYDYFWRSRDRRYSRYVDEARRRLPAGAEPSVFVLGHTHLPDRAQERANMISGGLLKIPMQGFSPRRGSLTPVVINGGAWQRTITPVQLERRLGGRPLNALGPDDLTPCYGFVEIPPYADAPAPQVRYWRRDAAGQWAMAADCG
jgi:hypothetical protein